MTNEFGRDSLGDRMKGYEDQYRFKLAPRSFVMVRLDGKAFHTFTRGLARPWDRKLINAMNDTTRDLCKGMSGAVMGYVQSDEISILLAPGHKLTSEPWFDNNLQKIVSVSASACTAMFNHYFGGGALANFDSRAFVLPEDEVVNYFVWRQQDATRNSIQMLARTHFSHSQCNNKDTSQLQDMLMTLGVNWNDELVRFKRGSACRKAVSLVPIPDEYKKFQRDGEESAMVSRGIWVVDPETPIFTQDRAYITDTWKRIEE